MHPSDKFVLFAVLTLSATATMLSGWMWRSSAGSRSLPGCGVESSCAAVTRSRWAKWGPVPVTSLGMLLFVAIFTAALCSLFSATGWVVLECLAFAACGAAGWFLLLQALVIRRFCA
jgi:uncharacterized membrane protein